MKAIRWIRQQFLHRLYHHHHLSLSLSSSKQIESSEINNNMNSIREPTIQSCFETARFKPY
ncbi:hypothetical protein DERF_007227 [Dermatophagoides farinae]|uniref:Uncharacterized protein n=1 Tax=Dermatophagoides farinae TaxID=6954 RepID=A0A922L7S0_DERFA|nr:hypothetical protein DERF_007227 [Dermatophagoides farinae]